MRKVSSLSIILWLAFVSPLFADETGLAASLIPFDALSPTNQALVRSVTDHCTLLRQYAGREFKARKREFEYLMDHMDACSTLAQGLGLIEYRAVRDAQGRIFADDHQGGKGTLTVAYGGDGKRVYHVQGTEQGMFTVEGRAVAVVDYAQTGTNTVRYSGAIFVKVDNVVIAAMAQMFEVFVQSTVDGHFHHVMHHPIKLSQMATSNPQLLLEEIARMPEADRALLSPFVEMVRSATNNLAR